MRDGREMATQVPSVAVERTTHIASISLQTRHPARREIRVPKNVSCKRFEKGAFN